MTLADEARDSALHCEMVKYAYRQTRDGVVVSFVVHPNDIPAALSTAHIGARYMVALVQIGDDELPIKAAPKAVKTYTVAPEKSKRDWRDLQPAAQAGIRCSEPRFYVFLNETRQYQIANEEDAAEAVREICGIKSRIELGTNHKARVIWHQLDEQFLAWKYVDA